MRKIELGLEQALDGIARAVFRGPLHLEEIVSRLERAADMASSESDLGPTTANVYRLVLNPEDVSDDVSTLEAGLSAALETSAMQRGWRLEGPSTVILTTDTGVASGTLRCDPASVPGQRSPWCRLAGGQLILVNVNRAVIGRSESADVVIDDDTVSRRHAILWTESGSAHLRDLGSTNGTRVEGEAVWTAVLAPGAIIAFGEATFRYETVP